MFQIIIRKNGHVSATFFPFNTCLYYLPAPDVLTYLSVTFDVFVFFLSSDFVLCNWISGNGGNESFFFMSCYITLTSRRKIGFILFLIIRRDKYIVR